MARGHFPNVGGVLRVLIESNRIRDFFGIAIDGEVDPE